VVQVHITPLKGFVIFIFVAEDNGLYLNKIAEKTIGIVTVKVWSFKTV